jgi:hypothetical protein
MINLDLDCDLYYTFNNVKNPKLPCFLIKRSSQQMPHPGQYDAGLHLNSRSLKDFDRPRRLILGWKVLEHCSHYLYPARVNHREGPLPTGNEDTQGFKY